MNSPRDHSADIPLGYWPAINAWYHQYFGQSSLLIQLFSGRGEIDDRALNHSLTVTSARHPLLNCQLVESDDGLALRTVASNGNRLEHLQVEKLDAYEIASQLLAEGLEVQMWRVILVRAADKPDAWILVMLCHHAIGDALSMTSFFDQLLTHYAEQGPDSNTVFELPVLPEKLAGMEIPGSAAEPELSEWRIDEFAALERRQVGLLEIPLATINLNKLLEACQRERVSLTNLITVALLRARGFTARARVATAADIRRRVKPAIAAEQFGCYAGVVESSVPWAEDIWDHARLASVYQFRGKSRLLMPVPKGPILKLLMKMRIDKALDAHIFAGGCAVSDVGELAVQQHYGRLTIDDIHLSNRQLAGLYAVFMTASSFAGKLSLNLSFADPLLSIANAKKLRQGIAEQLQSCIP